MALGARSTVVTDAPTSATTEAAALDGTSVDANAYAVAAVVSTTLPIFFLVMFFQKQIVSGLTAGAVKG